MGDEPFICKYFADAESAYAHGMKQQCKFEIEKSRIVGLDGIETPIMPNPFDAGDIVQDIRTGVRGVVELSQEEWKDFWHVWRQVCMRIFQMQVSLWSVYGNGGVSHSHISPIFLERHEPEKEDDDYDLLIAASGLCRGKGSLDWFIHCYDAYKKKCQQAKAKEA